MLPFFRLANLWALFRAELINKQQLLVLKQFSIFHQLIAYVIILHRLIFRQFNHFIGTSWEFIVVLFFQIFLKHVRESHIFLLHLFVVFSRVTIVSFMHLVLFFLAFQKLVDIQVIVCLRMICQICFRHLFLVTFLLYNF